jgi:anti-anti-sigma factor
MSNDEIIQGFDNETEESLTLSLKKADEVEGCLILSLAGAITTYNTHFFQKQVVKVIEAGYTNLIFHCSGLTHISASGIGSFSVFLKWVKSKGGEVVLAAMQPQVQDVFHLLGFAQVFVIKESLEASIKVFRGCSAIASALGFPRILICPVCSKKLKALKQGRFRCSACKTILAIDSQGQVCLG